MMRKGMLAVMFCLLLLRGSAQVVNDSCLSAIDLGALPYGSVLSSPCFSGVPCITIEDSTDFALPNFPYPTIPNNCSGYVSGIASPAKDLWYKFTINCDFTFRVENSDTLHISFWIGDTCSNLVPITCYTIPSSVQYSQTLSGLGGQHTIFLQVSSQNVSSQNTFTVCLAAGIPFCSPTFDLSNPTSVLCCEYNSATTPCSGSLANDGTATISIVNGNAPYTCIWNDGYTGFYRDSMAPGNYFFTITDANGCVEVDSVSIGIYTGNSMDNLSNKVCIFFNPLNGEIFINLDEISPQWILNYEFLVTNLTGKVIYRSNLSTSKKFLLNAEKGMYFLSLKSGVLTYNKRVILLN